MKKVTLGEIVIRLMEVKKISCGELSKRTGLSSYAVTTIRRNTRKHKIETLKAIAKELDVPINLLAKYR